MVQDRIPLAWLPKPTVVCCGCDQRTDTTLSMLDETFGMSLSMGLHKQHMSWQASCDWFQGIPPSWIQIRWGTWLLSSLLSNPHSNPFNLWAGQPAIKAKGFDSQPAQTQTFSCSAATVGALKFNTTLYYPVIIMRIMASYCWIQSWETVDLLRSPSSLPPWMVFIL